MENLQDGDRFYYLTRTAGLNMLTQLEGNSFSEMIMRNTSAEGLPAEVFARPDFTFNVPSLGLTGPILDDPETPEWAENLLLTRNIPTAGTIRFAGGEHVIWIGSNSTTNVDRLFSSEGDDTLRLNGGNDRAEGGAGNDQFIGGEGDDILTDNFGDDVIKGGHGDDYISSGQGFDLNQGGLGADFVVGGSDPTETFGGDGNDMILAGQSSDTIFGDDGDDWIEGGNQADLLQGDNGAPFQNDINAPGNDVIIGDGGNDDYDSEGGDDIMVGGPGIERSEGMLGFDWVTHRGDPQAADDDMFFTGLLPPDLDNIRERFDDVEALSGWNFNDILRGTDNDAAALGTEHQLDAAGIARITGLAAILPAGATSFNAGDILVGGNGNDLMEGRGGDDIIDGDRWLNVQLSNGTLTGDAMATFRTQVAAGTLDPGTISIARTLVNPGPGTATDTALFSGARAEYITTANANGSVTIDHQGGIDGVDTLWNVERAQFADQIVSVVPTATATPTTLTFPSRVIGSTSAASLVTISNTGLQSLVVSGVTTTGTDATQFTTTNTCTTVASGGTCTVSVRFAPTTVGAKVATLNIASNAPGSPTTVGLSGTAVAVVVTAPGAPTGVTAVRGNGNFTVSWAAPANNGGSPITGYSVRVVNPAGNQVGALRPSPGTGTSLVVAGTGLTVGTNYRFQVSATNAAGTGPLSALSTALSFATAPNTATPLLALSGAAGGAVSFSGVWLLPAANSGGLPRTLTQVFAQRYTTAAGTTAVGAPILIPGIGLNTQSATFTVPAGFYRYRIVVTNAVGSSTSANSGVAQAR